MAPKVQYEEDLPAWNRPTLRETVLMFPWYDHLFLGGLLAVVFSMLLVSSPAIADVTAQLQYTETTCTVTSRTVDYCTGCSGWHYRPLYMVSYDHPDLQPATLATVATVRYRDQALALSAVLEHMAANPPGSALTCWHSADGLEVYLEKGLHWRSFCGLVAWPVLTLACIGATVYVSRFSYIHRRRTKPSV
ncbi:hypothetical protein KIPB_005381 [Kipferlia bialata]|uniref:Uncharacterized protein n=1 Tax=Kipferlia bialata TaxID=797122 RepID=A0A9K3CVB1_9EUKA|nr:hypothetical protein KIPB_005381 [Kipferlia bialata]|eukprot:g5381.t1